MTNNFMMNVGDENDGLGRSTTWTTADWVVYDEEPRQ